MTANCYSFRRVWNIFRMFFIIWLHSFVLWVQPIWLDHRFWLGLYGWLDHVGRHSFRENVFSKSYRANSPNRKLPWNQITWTYYKLRDLNFSRYLTWPNWHVLLKCLQLTSNQCEFQWYKISRSNLRRNSISIWSEIGKFCMEEYLSSIQYSGSYSNLTERFPSIYVTATC